MAKRKTSNEKKGIDFYMFDIDDNLLFLQTKNFIYEKHTKKEVGLSTSDFAKISPFLNPNQLGAYQINDKSFRDFRDSPTDPQPFVEDVKKALASKKKNKVTGNPAWQAPSWPLFVYAVSKGRPITFITARGHSRETIKTGIEILRQKKHISKEPNYLSIYAVSNPEIQKELVRNPKNASVPVLKKKAIIQTVKAGFEKYGFNTRHRFGMSDDDPQNVKLILEAMDELKQEYPNNAFFGIDTNRQDGMIRIEVGLNRKTKKPTRSYVFIPQRSQKRAGEYQSKT